CVGTITDASGTCAATGDIVVNSKSSSAISASGGVCPLIVATNIGLAASGSPGGCTSGITNPVVPVSDPLASLPQPPVPACDHTGSFEVLSSATLNSGVYCGGIIIRR